MTLAQISTKLPQTPQVPMHDLGEIQGLIDRYDRLISIIPMELVTDCLQDKSIDNRCEGGLPGCPTRKSIWLSADLGDGHRSTIIISRDSGTALRALSLMTCSIDPLPAACMREGTACLNSEQHTDRSSTGRIIARRTTSPCKEHTPGTRNSRRPSQVHRLCAQSKTSLKRLAVW